jgi:hypothetical protein
MNVQLTCRCGRRQDVSIALAGKTTPCTGCGQPLTVPALGIAVSKGTRPAPRPAPRPASEPSPFAALRSATPAPARRSRMSCGGATALLLILSVVCLVLMAGLGIWQFGLHEHLPTFGRFAEATPAPHAMPPLDLPAPAPHSATPVKPPTDVPENATQADTPPGEPPVNKPAPAAGEPPINKPAEAATAAPVGKPVAPVAENAPPEKKPAVPVALPARPFQEDDTFVQDLVVTQKSRFLVQGIPIATLLQYRVASRYKVNKVHADGGLLVEQKVEAAMLMQADELTQGLLAAPMAQLPGTQFTLEVSPRGEVTRLAGAGGMPVAAPARVPGGLGVQMASLLDIDGWKELGQATFYQPEQLDKAAHWTRPMMHGWGPLGGWAGQVTYAYPGPDKAAPVKVPYVIKLAYQPPKGPGIPGALPFQVAASNFKAPEAAGIIHFNTQTSRTVAAQERFQVRGALVLVLLGQKTPTEVEEEQIFEMRILPK